jgi:hypothetical protein
VTLFRPDLPPGLVRIIETAMAKDRDLRYSDLNLMASALEDELMPPTPAPRLLTPVAGVSSFASRDLLSGPLAPAAEAIPKKQPSGKHQETQILFALAGKVESKENGAQGNTNRGSKHGPEELADVQPEGRETVLLRRSSRKPLLSGPRSPSGHRRWRGPAGAGLGVALGFLMVWIAMRTVTQAETGAPARVANAAQPASQPVAQPAVPALASTATPAALAVPAPLAASLSPPAPSQRVAPEHSRPASRAHATPAPVTPSRSRLAMRETSNYLPTRPQALREAWERNEPARAPSSTPGARAFAKSTAPRAGRLSEADF